MDYKINVRMFNEHGILEEVEVFKKGYKETIKFILLSLSDDGIIDNVIRIDTKFMKLVKQSIKFENGKLIMADKEENVKDVFNR